MPERNKWEGILKHGESNVCKGINYIKEIEQTGSEVFCYSVDIGSMDEVENVINKLRARFGRINGIFHCAGVAGGSFLIRRTEKEVEEVLGPKVFGTWILDYLTRIDNPDFFVMCSSGLSVVGEPGNSDYTAANCYLGTYSAYRRKKGMKTLVLDWPSWKETGMSVRFGINKDMVFKALSTEQAVNVLEEAMNKDINRLLIGKLNDDPQYLYMLDWATFRLPPKLISYIEKLSDQGAKKDRVSKHSQNQSVELKGRDSLEFSEIEKIVAGIYYEILGLEEINIYDSFFELGGDSIMLNRLYVLLDRQFPGKLKLIDAFSYTSIASMSQHLAGGMSETAATSDVELNEFINMFDEIDKGNLSIEDAVKSIYDL